jgi:hypothetical protein
MRVGPAGPGAWLEPVEPLVDALDPEPLDTFEPVVAASPVGVDSLDTGSLEPAGDGDAAASVMVGAGDPVERCVLAECRALAGRAPRVPAPARA